MDVEVTSERTGGNTIEGHGCSITIDIDKLYTITLEDCRAIQKYK